VEDSFELLEERVRRAVERLKSLSAEVEALRAEVAQANRRAEKAEAGLAAATRREGAGSDQVQKAAALAGELKAMRREREDVRARVEKLVGLLESL
jgi:FtsZ-binding cell division protein ZapB